MDDRVFLCIFLVLATVVVVDGSVVVVVVAVVDTIDIVSEVVFPLLVGVAVAVMPLLIVLQLLFISSCGAFVFAFVLVVVSLDE